MDLARPLHLPDQRRNLVARERGEDLPELLELAPLALSALHVLEEQRLVRVAIQSARAGVDPLLAEELIELTREDVPSTSTSTDRLDDPVVRQ